MLTYFETESDVLNVHVHMYVLHTCSKLLTSYTVDADYHILCVLHILIILGRMRPDDVTASVPQPSTQRVVLRPHSHTSLAAQSSGRQVSPVIFKINE